MRRVFRHLGWITLAAGLCLGAVAYLRAPNGVAATMRKMDDVHRMEEENSRLREEIRQRQDRILQLKTNENYRNKTIREKLNVQRPNEKTIYVTPPAK